MILNEVHRIVTSAIDEPCPPLSVMAFHQGIRIPDWILARMIDAATRGYITGAGMQLLLIPTSTYKKAKRDSVARIKAAPRRKNGKKRNLTPWPEIKKTDCLALCDYLPMPGPTEHQKQCFDPAPIKGLRGVNGNCKGVAKVSPKTGINRNAKCVSCRASLAGKRSDAKFCCSACRQKHNRSGA